MMKCKEKAIPSPIKNTHEAIIDEETWNNAQRLRKTVRRSPKYGTTSHPFTGLLICADCGGKLSYREAAEHKEKKYDSDYSLYVNITDTEKALAVCTTSK